GVGFQVALRAETIHGGINHLIEDDRRPEIGFGYFEADVLKREALDVADVHTIGRRSADFEILTCNLRYFPDRFLRSATAFVNDMNVLETDLLDKFAPYTIDYDAEAGLAGPKPLRPR